MKRNLLRGYLEDPLLSSLMTGIRNAGPIRSSMVDLTHRHNLQCLGCYHYPDQRDHQKCISNEMLDEFIQREAGRKTNMLIITGGEPAYEIDRLRRLAKHFKLMIVTNGTIPIPIDGLEQARIAISFRGNEYQHLKLFGHNKKAQFERVLMNYRNDTRTGFYYTFNPTLLNNIERDTHRIIKNGNYIAFNVHAGLSKLGSSYSHENSLSDTCQAINQLIARYPAKIISSPYIHEILTKRRMLGTPWGYKVCPSNRDGQSSSANSKAKRSPSSFEFRAYNADLRSTKQCNSDITEDCDTCADLWLISSWIAGAMREHLSSHHDFFNWLCSTYIVYLQTGFIDWNTGSSLLPALYQKMGISYAL
jgi:hypothetical protein